jgi:hypothetical protein
LTVLLWALLASPEPTSLRGTGALLVAVIVGLGVALNQATGWRAWRRPSRLDERESRARDQAYRFAFRGMGVGIFVVIVTSLIATYLPPRPDWPTPLAFSSGPRYLVAVLLLLAVLAPVCLAWSETAGQSDAPPTRRGPLIPLVRAGSAPLAAVVLVLLAWSAAVALVPAQTVMAEKLPSPSVSVGGGSCATVEVSEELGGGLGSAVTVDANVCWNGHRAWDGNRGLPPPTEDLAADRPRAFNCSLGIDAGDFEEVSAESCTEQADASGTFRFVARARVGSGIGDWLDRTLGVTVAVTAKGKVRLSG